MLTNPARAKVPAIYTGHGGIEDPWGRILADNWVPIWASDGIASAFIWNWPTAKATSPPNPAPPWMPRSPPLPEWTPRAWNSSTPMAAASYAARLHVKGCQGPAAPAALSAFGPVRLSETGQLVVVETAGTRLVLDKRSGQIASWRAGDRDIVLAGLILNLGESIATVLAALAWEAATPGLVVLAGVGPLHTHAAVAAGADNGHPMPRAVRSH